jgi:hypothetical protein
VLDLLLPRTDAGALFQVVVVTIVFGALTWAVRRQRDWRTLVIGIWLLLYGGMALRAVH